MFASIHSAADPSKDFQLWENALKRTYLHLMLHMNVWISCIDSDLGILVSGRAGSWNTGCAPVLTLTVFADSQVRSPVTAESVC